MDYAKALARGRILLGRLNETQWELARLTYQVVTAGERGIITQWAQDLGVSRPYASNLYTVWREFGERYDRNEVGERSFNDCLVEARASHERAERLRREAEESGLGVGTVDRRPAGPDDERERRKDFHRRLRDTEEVRRAVRRDQATREAFRKVYEEEFGPPPPAAPPPPAGTPAGRLIQQLVQNLEAVRDRLNRTLVRMIKTKLTRENRARLGELVEQIENSVDWTRSFLDSGNTSFEEMLRELVAEEEPAEEPVEPSPPPRRPVPPKDPVAAEPAAEAPPTPRTRPRPARPKGERARRMGLRGGA